MNALSKMLCTLLPATLLLSGLAFAQVPDRVGRVAYLSGDVQFYSESAQAWVPTQLNAPVTSRNSLFTGADGRAEIRFGSTALALDAATQLDIHTFDDSRFKAGVTRGSVSVRVGQIEVDESFELMAPAASYAILQAGRYRVDAAGDESSVSVHSGLVNASVAGNVAAMVGAGQSLSAASNGFSRGAARRSALDQWAEQRDAGYRSSQSARYVSPNMTGYEELDANGRWASDPDYGNVWYPTTYVSAGWVPYRDGRWAYVAPWGWTWIDAAPWGFAPFHYGRWVLVGSRWGWMPGAYVRRPSYAPALVGFIGGSTAGGAAISISIGSRPAVGWYPLPPWERYRPAYGHHDRHAQNINNFRISQPPSSAWRTVEHQRVSANLAQGATIVPHEAFVESRPVRRAALPVSAPVLVAPTVAATPVLAPAQQAAPVIARPESGERRNWREQDQGRAERGRSHVEEGRRLAQPVPAAETAPVLQQPVPAASGSSPRIFRSEAREGERQVQPAAVAPSLREAAPTQPAQVSPVIAPDSGVVGSSGERRGERRSESRNDERQTQRPAPSMPQAVTLPAPVPGGKPAVAEPVAPARSEPAPAVALPAQRQIQPAAPLPERSAESPFRREGRAHESAPATVVQPAPEIRQALPQPVIAAPAVRVELPAARPEPRIEQRVESRPAPRVEPRSEPRAEPRPEPRPEPRQVQRSEPPPQVHAPAPAPQPQPEQKRAPESEHERRQHGDRDKDKDKGK